MLPIKTPITYLNQILDSAFATAHVDRALDPDQGFDVGIQTVAHQFELAIRRNETNGSVILEARQTHALMELDVFHLNGLALCHGTLRVCDRFVLVPLYVFVVGEF